MNSPAQDIKDLLDSASSAIGLTFADDLFCFKQPDSPDLCVTLYDTGGFAPQPNFRLDRPTVQARIRGGQNQYREAYAVAEDVKEFLRNLSNQTVNGTRYIGFWAMNDIFFAGYDDKSRPEFTINFRMMRTE